MRFDGVVSFGVEALWMFNANEHRFEARKMIQQRRNGVVATQGPPKPLTRVRFLVATPKIVVPKARFELARLLTGF